MCRVRPRLPLSCMVVSIHVRCGCPMGLEWPGMECAIILILILEGLPLFILYNNIVINILYINYKSHTDAACHNTKSLEHY